MIMPGIHNSIDFFRISKFLYFQRSQNSRAYWLLTHIQDFENFLNSSYFQLNSNLLTVGVGLINC